MFPKYLGDSSLFYFCRQDYRAMLQGAGRNFLENVNHETWKTILTKLPVLKQSHRTGKQIDTSQGRPEHRSALSSGLCLRVAATAVSSSGLHWRGTNRTAAFGTQLYIRHVFSFLSVLFFYILPLLLPVGPSCFQHFVLKYQL